MKKKIDRRRNYYIVFDTETAPMDKTVEGVNAHNMLTYDLGWCVVDRHGNVYDTYSYVVKEVYEDEKELMQSAYYSNKLPMYQKDIEEGRRTLASFYEIRKALCDCMAEYRTNIVIAHNARFDDVTLKVTQRWLTKSKYRYFFPYGTEIWDTLKMARDILGNRKTYIKFCYENNYLTKNGYPRFTAEILYRYISRNKDFVESHTGLEDTLIEKDIFHFCMKQRKPMRKALYEN